MSISKTKKFLIEKYGEEEVKEIYNGIFDPRVLYENYLENGNFKQKYDGDYSDIIRVEYKIISHGKTRKGVMDWIKNHIKTLNDLTLLKINERKKKYFINTNLLKLTNLIYTQDSRLIYTFEYKIPRYEETH